MISKLHVRKYLVLAGLPLAVAILVVLAYLSIRATRQFKSVTEGRNRSNEILQELKAVLENVVSSDTGQRGFLLTGDPKFLMPFAKAQNEIPQLMGKLEVLSLENEEQKELFLRFRLAINAHGAYLAQTIHDYQVGQRQKVVKRFASGEGMRLVNDIRELVGILERRELMALDRHRDEVEKKGNFLQSLIIYGILGSIFLICAAFAVMTLEIRRRIRSEADLRKAKNEAIEASQYKTSFLAKMSHEIRTPMNGILGMAEIMEQSTLSGDQRQYLSAIQDSGRGLLALVNDILDISKVESGKLELESSHFSLPKLLESLRGIFEYTSRHKGIPFRIVVDPRVEPNLIGDSLRLRQILVNLVGNAFKFSNKGEVTLVVDTLKNPPTGLQRLRFQVKDEGVGFDQKTLAKLFTSFTQADASTTRKFGGSGLGLMISKQLVEMMGGHIFAQGTPGVGACFTFEIDLPIGELTYEQTETLPAVPHLQALRSARVLVVDDNEINQKVAVGMLNRMGHDSVVVSNGVEALNILEKVSVDVVLMDGHMPTMDGYEATRRIRSSGKAYYNLPIIATTANAVQGEYDRALNAGMDEYTIKPLSYEDLFNKIENQIRVHDKLGLFKKSEWVRKESLDNLKELQDGDESFILELADIFYQSIPAELARMKELAANSEVNEVMELAHKVKSSCRNLGLFHMAEICEAIEKDFTKWTEKERTKALIHLERCYLFSIDQLKRILENYEIRNIA